MASLQSLWLGSIGNVCLFLLYPLLRTGDYLWMCDDVLFYQWLMYCVYVVWYWVWWLGVRESSYVNHMGRNLFFCNMKQAFNGKGILLNWLLRSIYKKWDFSREKFSGNLTWNRFPVGLSISDPSQKSDVWITCSLWMWKSFSVKIPSFPHFYFWTVLNIIKNIFYRIF